METMHKNFQVGRNTKNISASVNIVSAYDSLYIAPYRHVQKSNYPSYHCYIYSISGEGRVVLSNGDIVMLEENTIYMNKFTNIRILECPKGEWHFHIIWFQPNGFAIPLNKSVKSDFDDEEQFMTDLISLVNTPQDSSFSPNFNLFMANCKLLERLSKILLLFNTKFPSSAKSKEDQIIDYIYDNLNSQLKLDEIAKAFNYSENQLRRVFVKKTGVLPKKYILNIKLRKACELLSTTDYTIEYIALSLGFLSVPQFMNTFKKTYKKTPTEYRNTATPN